MKFEKIHQRTVERGVNLVEEDGVSEISRKLLEKREQLADLIQ